MTTIAEEQDFAFAMGLYRDSVFQMASEQFRDFVARYPASPKRYEAAFLRIESLYALNQYSASLDAGTEYLNRYPESGFIADVRFRRGQALLQLKRPNEAVAEFRKVLELTTDRPVAGEAAYWIGESYLRNGDDENAIKYFQLASEGYPNSTVRDFALYSVGWIYQRRGDFRRAAEAFTAMATAYPKSPLTPEALVRAEECTFQLKDYKRVLTQTEALRPVLVTIDHRARNDLLSAEASFESGDFAAARSSYGRVIGSYPDHPSAREAQYGLGWTLLRLKEYPGAVAAFAPLISGSDALAHAAMFRSGLAWSAAGRPDTAMSLYALSVQRFPQGEYAGNALYEHASLLIAVNQWSAARTLLERLVREYPKRDVTADAARLIGECLMAEGRYADAMPGLRTVAEDAGAPAESRMLASYQLAWSAYKQKQYAEAAGLFGRFLTAYPSSDKAHLARFWKAESEYAAGRFAEARASYIAASKDAAGEKREEALYGAGWSAFKLGKHDDAITGFEHLLAAYPKGARAFDARLRLGDAYFARKEFRKAAASYQLAIRLFPGHAGLDYPYYQAGSSFQKAGDDAEAYRAFEALVSLLPSSPLADDAQYAMGWINFQKKEYTEAVKEFQKVVRNYPDGDVAPRAVYSMADAYYNQQMFEPAVTSYRELLKRYPDSPLVADATTGIQYCLVALGRDAEAVQVIDDFIRDHPSSPVAEDLSMKKGEMLFNGKHYAAAAGQYRVFLKQFPGSKQSGLALFWIGECDRAQGDLLEAAEMYERSAAAPGVDHATAARSLLEAGRIYVEQKNTAKASAVLAAVIKRNDPPTAAADALLLYGVLFERIGNLGEATAQYERLTKNYPALDAADDARVRIARIRYQSGSYGDARTLAERVATSRKDALGAEAQMLVGETYAKEGKWTEAVKAYLRVRYVFPAQPLWIARASLGAGIAYERQKDPKHAAEQYQLAKRGTKDPDVLKEADQRLRDLGPQ